MDKTGKLLKLVGQKGRGEGEFDRPLGLTIIVGDKVIVCDCDNHRLQVFTSDLVIVRQSGSPGSGNGQFQYPNDIDITHDEDGNLYVTDYGNNCVQVLNFSGVFLRILVAPDHISEPVGITYYQGLLCISQWKQNKELYVCHKNGEEGCSIQCDNSIGCVATNQDGFIYICNYEKYEVVVI